MKNLISVVFFLVALIYIIYAIDFNVLFDNIASYSISSILFLVLFNVLSLILMSYRFTILFNKAPFLDSFRINTISMGINQLVPARGGDVLKPFMLKKIVKLKLSYFFAIISIERFLDVLVLSILAFVFLSIRIEYLYVYFILLVLLTIFFKSQSIKKLIKIIKFIKNSKVRIFILKFYITLIRFNKINLIKSFIVTIFMYIMYLITMYIFINYFTKFNLELISTIKVFIFSTLGLLVPSAPASLGTYEASMVFALGLFDITKEDALSFALVYHFIQISTILTLTGIFILRKNNE